MGRFANLELSDGTGPDGDAGAPRRDWRKLAREAMREGSYESALRYWSRTLAAEQRVEEAWVGQAVCLLQLGEYDEAIAWSDRALGLFPQSADLVAVKAVAWGRIGNAEKALGFADAALEAASPGAFVWWARGDVLMAQNPKNARFCFNKAAELAGDDWTLGLWIARTYLSVDDPGTARLFLIRAEQKDPGNPQLWFHLGLCARSLGLDDEAKKAFRLVLARHPGHEEAAAGLAALESKGPLARLGTTIRHWLGGR